MKRPDLNAHFASHADGFVETGRFGLGHAALPLDRLR